MNIDKIYSKNLEEFIGDWEKFARDWLKENVAKLSALSQHLFKAMYSYEDLEKPLNQVIDDMATEKLDWAMKQVENTHA